MGTVRREPIETAGRGVAAACVRSGISGWVIGLLIGWRAGAERRAANARCEDYGVEVWQLAKFFSSRWHQTAAAHRLRRDPESYGFDILMISRL